MQIFSETQEICDSLHLVSQINRLRGSVRGGGDIMTLVSKENRDDVLYGYVDGSAAGLQRKKKTLIFIL